MKKFIFILTLYLFVTNNMIAQDFNIIPKAKVEYSLSPNTPIHQNDINLSFGNGIIHHVNTIYLGNLSTSLGIEFKYKSISLLFDNITYMHTNGYKYSPIQTDFIAMLQYRFVGNRIKAYIEHACFHPFETKKYNIDKKYNGYNGGYTKVGVSYNY